MENKKAYAKHCLNKVGVKVFQKDIKRVSITYRYNNHCCDDVLAFADRVVKVEFKNGEVINFISKPTSPTSAVFETILKGVIDNGVH